ncbi:tetratricopeptide repeat-containing sensor histidine kinase [Spongiivirga citrea]|uniref:Tetratricopeptide repeat protein n=1 Tax=Spongiivirga citrea TaxID=1481457 RepID=A0A6M0CDH9_9FLAO|nr:tetratricopeptide repeat protein [Spongiivirga citrea]NER15878.1 tetratricopeptide repeat protein [Spongiivirga citrea]
MSIKKTTLIILLLFCALYADLSAQDTDAVKAQIEDALTTSKKYALVNRDSALYYVNRAEDLSKSLKDKTLTIRVKNQKSAIHIYRAEFDKAQQLLEENIDEAEIDEVSLTTSYQNLGTVFNYKQDFEKAVAYYLKASELAEKNKDTASLGKIYSNVGGIHARLKNTDKASDYLNKAIEFLDKNEPQKMQVIVNLAALAFSDKKIDEAISLSLETEQLAIKNKIPVFLGIIYSNLCNYYLGDEQFEKSIYYGKKGIEYKKQFKQNTDVILNNLGYAYLQKGDPDEAIRYLEMLSPNISAELRVLTYNNLREAYQLKNDTKKALGYANLYAVLKDSISEVSQRREVAELTEKYESAKQEQQIEVLEAKDELNSAKINAQRSYFLIAGILGILLLVSGFLWYRNQRTKQSLKTAKIQHKLLQTQLNPHFLFHALNSIQSFVFQNRKDESVNYLGSFSKLMRSILESSDRDFIDVEEDVKALESYLDLQKLNTTNQWDFEIEMDDGIEDSMLLIPPMFTQPHAENAILHGFKEIENGILKVKYQLIVDGLQVTISDNGNGINENKEDAKQLNRSMSTQILSERIDNLKKTHQFHCKVKTESTMKGTTVYLDFPIRYGKL